MAKVVKDSLQSLTSSEPMPMLPAFDPDWSLQRYNDEMANWQRKLMEYLRRLFQRLTGPNIFNELIEQLTPAQLLQLGGGGKGALATSYGFGPVSIEVYLDYAWTSGSDAFGGTKAGTIYHTGLRLSHLEQLIGIGLDDGIGSATGGDGVFTHAVRVTCKLVPKHTETYTFYLTADDGVRFYLNNGIKFDNWGSGAFGGTTTFAATAGVPIALKLELVNFGGGEMKFDLQWSSATETSGHQLDIPYGSIQAP